jgi:hypothetical protein
MEMNIRPNLRQLSDEIAAAGILIPNGLGAYGIDENDSIVVVHTYDAVGTIIDLPPEAGPILLAHIPPTPPAKIDTGTDVPPDQYEKLAEAVVTLRNYLQVATPTAAQSAGALKLLIRIVLFVLKRQGY